MAAKIDDLLKWQLEKIEANCRLLTDHATDPTCSCELDLTSCLRKHALLIEHYAIETLPIIKDDSNLIGFLEDLSIEAREIKDHIASGVCGNGKGELDLAKIAQFGRDWAKKIESSYTCQVAPVSKMAEYIRSKTEDSTEGKLEAFLRSKVADLEREMFAKYPGRCPKCGGKINVGDKIDWEPGRGARHVVCPAATSPGSDLPTGSFRISVGEGYGGRSFRVGEVLRWRDKGIVKVLSASKSYVREEGMSFGVGDEQGYIYSAVVMPASESEAAPVLEAEAKRILRADAVRELESIKKDIQERGERPPGEHSPEGKRIFDTQDIYGGGDWFVVGTDTIWYVRNNGMDGDDWSLNNVRTGGAGAIGWRVPYNEVLANRLTSLSRVVEGEAKLEAFLRSKEVKMHHPLYVSMVVENQPRTKSKTVIALMDTGSAISGITREDAAELEIGKTGVMTLAVAAGKRLEANFGNCFTTINGRTFNMPIWLEANHAIVGWQDLQNRGLMGEEGVAPISKLEAFLRSKGAVVSPTVKITGTCKPDEACNFKVVATDKTEARATSIKELPRTIDEVIQRRGQEKARVTDKTFAIGTTGVTRYEFQFKIVEAGALIVSHDPSTFAPNPKYPRELQPRLRERAATRLQVDLMAATLDPDALLVDFQSIDRGAPIVGSDMVVESGNGRVMAVLLAFGYHPDVYGKYRDALKKIAPSYNLSPKAVDKLKIPILVRERLTKVDRKQFVEEANASTTIESSAIENARTDAEKISLVMLASLEVLESENIEDAIRAGRNKAFAGSFLEKLPANERARLVDAKGVLNQDGVRRIAMAIFVATFQGDAGLRLAEKFFESTDINVRNVFAGIGRSLGLLSRAEALSSAGERYRDYLISDDLAKAISIFSAIKKTPGMTVSKYLAQMQMIERELTPFQERILEVLDEHSRSAKRIGQILGSYAELVINSPPPGQASLLPDMPRASKEEMFELAVKQSATFEDSEWLGAKIDRCNLTKVELDRALNWKPLRDFVAWGVGKGKVSLCSIRMVEGVYQVGIKGLDMAGQSAAAIKAKAIPTAKRVYTPYAEVVYEVVIPENGARELTWEPQEVKRMPKFVPSTQAALFARLPYAHPIPKEIIFSPKTIEKHYLARKDIHPDSIRVVKPKPDVLVYLACKKEHDWDPEKSICSPNPSVYKSTVPLTTEYEKQAEDWIEAYPGIKVTRDGILKEEDKELAEVIGAMGTAEEVS